MSEYGISLVVAREMTREQLFLMRDKIIARKDSELKQQAKLHGAKVKSSGLDIDGATPLETIIDNGKQVM